MTLDDKPAIEEKLNLTQSESSLIPLLDRSFAISEIVKLSSETLSSSSQKCLFKFRTGNACNDFREQLNLMRKQSALCDVALVCGNSYLPVHRLILAVGCPYLKDQLKMLSEQELAMHLNKFDPELLSCFLDFMYTGKFQAFKYLDVHKLKEVDTLAKQLGLYKVGVCSAEIVKKELLLN